MRQSLPESLEIILDIPISLNLPLDRSIFAESGASAPKVAHIASVETDRFSKFGQASKVVN